MVNYDDVLVNDDRYYKAISLKKLLGDVTISDIECYASAVFGTDVLVFELYAIKLSNGEKILLEGEHDVAYFNDTDKVPTLTYGILESLYKQHPDYEGDLDYD